MVTMACGTHVCIKGCARPNMLSDAQNIYNKNRSGLHGNPMDAIMKMNNGGVHQSQNSNTSYGLVGGGARSPAPAQAPRAAR